MTGTVTIAGATREMVIPFTSTALTALAEPGAALQVIETAAYQSTRRTG
jgi:hypothetical protein